MFAARSSASLEALRAEIRSRFGDQAVVDPQAPLGSALGSALGSGVPAIDALLPHGGLRPGESALLRCAAGAGGLSLASAFCRHACRLGEAVAVVDASPACLPHPWVEPPEATGEGAAIWVITPAPAEAWAAVDILMRSGAFGLLALLDPPPAPRGAGPRLVRLMRQRGTRLLIRGESPFRPTVTLDTSRSEVDWQEAPVGATPGLGSLVVRCGAQTVELPAPGTLPDRVPPSPRAADRRPAHQSAGRAREVARGRTRRRPPAP